MVPTTTSNDTQTFVAEIPWNRLACIAAVALAYCVTGRLALNLAVPPGFATAVWPPAGIALAAVILWGRGMWPGILLGSFSVNLWMSLDSIAGIDPAVVVAASTVALGAVAQAFLALWLLNRFATVPPRLTTMAGVLRFALLAGVLGSACNSTIGPTVLLLLEFISGAQYWFNVWNWWVGDTLGVLVVTPLLLIWSNRTGKHWRHYRRGITVAAFLAFGGLVLMFRFADHREQVRVDLEFDRSAENMALAVRNEIGTTIAALNSLQSFFDSSGFVDPDEFRVFTQRALANNPTIAALSWNPYVSAEQREHFENERLPLVGGPAAIYEFDSNGRKRTAAQRSDYVVVEYIEPRAANQSVFGFDVASNAERRAAIEAARDSAQPTASSAVQLVQSVEQRPGILVFAPVYQGNAEPATVAERRALLLGVVVGVVYVDGLLTEALDGLHTELIGLELAEETAPGIFAPVHLVNESAVGKELALTREHLLSVAGRKWQLTVSAGNDYLAAHRAPGVWFVLAAGMILCAMLTGFLLVLAGHAQRDAERAAALAQANQQMAAEVSMRQRIQGELQREKARAEITLNCIGDGVISTDTGHRVAYMNPVAESLTGWSLDDAEGQLVDAVFRLFDDDGKPMPITRECSGQLDNTIWEGEHEVRLMHQDGREFEIRLGARPMRDDNGKMAGAVLVFQDETSARHMAREVAHRAAHDALTGLVNRHEFERRLDRAIQGVAVNGSAHALCFLDLDQFKIVNDTAGHAAGDNLLQQITHVILNRVRSRDTLARLGGDEFGLLLEYCPLSNAEKVAADIVSDIRNFRFVWNDQIFGIGVSVGIASVDGSTTDGAEVMQQADMACYTAKDLGRSRVHTFCRDNKHSRQRLSELHSAADLRSAIDDNRLVLFAQSIQPVCAAANQPPRYEILLRLKNADGSLASPMTFISAAERYDMMSDVDRWVVRETLADFNAIAGGRAHLSINLSGNSLDSEAFADFVVERLHANTVEGNRICFEITETAAIRNLDAAMQFMTRMRAIGCQFALDDFGSGISSFNYLKTLPVDYLKIDGSLVREVARDEAARAMVAAIHSVARTMKLATIAEHVSDAQILSVIKSIGIDYAQGYAVHKPEKATGVPGGALTIVSAFPTEFPRPASAS